MKLLAASAFGKCLEHGVFSCTWMWNTDAQMHKSAPTHILIESSPFRFHVVLCGPHSGLWNGFIWDFVLCLLTSCYHERVVLSIQKHLCRFYSHAMVFFCNVGPFPSLTTTILHISIPSVSLSILTLSPLTMHFNLPLSKYVLRARAFEQNLNLFLWLLQSVLHLLKLKAEHLWPRVLLNEVSSSLRKLLKHRNNQTDSEMGCFTKAVCNFLRFN